MASKAKGDAVSRVKLKIGTCSPAFNVVAAKHVVGKPLAAPLKGISAAVGNCSGTATAIISLAPGTYTIEYGTVSGYTAPPNSNATAASNQTTTITGSYTAVVIAPGAIVLNGGNSVSATSQTFSVPATGLEVGAILETKIDDLNCTKG